MGLCWSPCHVSQSTRIVKRSGKSTPSANVVVELMARSWRSRNASSISRRTSCGSVALW